MRKIFSLLLVVLTELFAFTMLLPILPFLIKDMGGGDLTITNITGIFALTSFVFSPFWGDLSDRHGRKVVLIGLLFVSALNYVWMAFAHSLWMVLVSRIMSGVLAGWMGVVQSWIADLSDRKNRTAALGMLGATFGVGFAVGPALGGILLDEKLQANLANLPLLGQGVSFFLHALPNPHQFPIVVAGVVTGLMALLAIIFLPHSAGRGRSRVDEVYITPGQDLPSPEKLRQRLLAVVFSPLWRDELAGRYLALMFFGQLAFATLQSVFIIWGQANFNYTARDISYIFAIIGVVTIVVQGGLIRPVVGRLGEKRAMEVGLVLTAFGFLSLNFFVHQNLVAIIVSAIAVGFNLYQPALNGSLSQNVSADKQGAALGLSQSLQSLARGLSAIFLGGLFGVLGNNIFLPPAIMFVVMLLVVARLPQAPVVDR